MFDNYSLFCIGGNFAALYIIFKLCETLKSLLCSTGKTFNKIIFALWDC